MRRVPQSSQSWPRLQWRNFEPERNGRSERGQRQGQTLDRVVLDARWQGTWAAIVTNAIARIDPTQILADERALLAVAPLTAVGAVRAKGAVSAVRIGPTVVTLPVVGESARVAVLAKAAVVGVALSSNGRRHRGNDEQARREHEPGGRGGVSRVVPTTTYG